MTAKIVWTTPDGDNLVAYMARVSNPDNQNNTDTAGRLIKYLIKNNHWSPFEMVNACVEIKTTRDIGRQLLRHRSFSFQEFSGRYAEYGDLNTLRECRMQDKSNRQSSNDTDDAELKAWWEASQQSVSTLANEVYHEALHLGIAKEQARAVLPEGLVDTTMYVNGTLRSWIHYWQVRCHEHTQKEHRLLAEETRSQVLQFYPGIKEALAL